MMDEELDRARADEASWLVQKRLKDGQSDRALTAVDVGVEAARLAREGWMPDDPLRAEVEKIAFPEGFSDRMAHGATLRLMRRALERGIELGKAKGELASMDADGKINIVRCTNCGSAI